MIPLSTIVQTVIDRINTCLPAKMTGAAIRWPDKPGDFTHDYVKKQFPHGALLVKHLKSTGDNGTELVVIGVSIVAETSLREEKLAEAVRGYVSKHQLAGLTRFEFNGDEPLEAEMGIVVRTVSFITARPAVPQNDIAAFNTALNL